MRAVFGIVGLLIAVSVVGWVAKKQLQAVGAVSAAPAAQAISGAPEAPQSPARGTPASVREQSQQLQRQVAEDVAKALSQGAAKASEPLQ